MEAGARFFQTQHVYSLKAFETFMDKVHYMNTRVIAGILVLKSVKMAHFLNKKVPGVYVPPETIKRLEDSKNPVQTGIEIAAEQIVHYRNLCQGAHIMSIKQEDKILDIINLAKSL